MSGMADGAHRARAHLDRLIGFAAESTDDDDVRLRKRVVVIAGYILVVAPLQLPILAQGIPLSWFVAATMPLAGAINLIVLARTRRFERYVNVLILIVLLFPAVIEVSLGGLAGASAALVFAFLGPVFALLGLGPRRATAWFLAFMLVVIGVIVIDPLVSSRIAPQPYPLRLVWYAANLGVPLGITFALLRYTDVRRRRAEARSQELLTNAIPRSIAARLQHGEERIAESYPQTTVLFADLAGFTPWARQTDPAHVVGFLDAFFAVFPAAPPAVAAAAEAHATVPSEDVANQLVVCHEDGVESDGELGPEPRRTFNVGEEKRHGARG
jgi:hypothetical protein